MEKGETSKKHPCINIKMYASTKGRKEGRTDAFVKKKTK
jgi:hypothetical protein